MNFGIKTKTFNALGTPNVNPGVSIESALEPGARLIGVVMQTGFLTPGFAGSATFAVYISVGGVATAVANGNATLVDTIRSFWTGVDGRHKDAVVAHAGPTADTVNGFIPIAMPPKWVDASGASYEVILQIITSGTGNCVVFYTLDPPIASGEQS